VWNALLGWNSLVVPETADRFLFSHLLMEFLQRNTVDVVNVYILAVRNHHIFTIFRNSFLFPSPLVSRTEARIS
jgi:hypothetical protein